MIHRETISSLTDMELCALLYIIKKFGPKRGFPIDSDVLSFYKVEFIHHILKMGKEKIRPEHKEFYKRLASKFGLEL